MCSCSLVTELVEQPVTHQPSLLNVCTASVMWTAWAPQELLYTFMNFLRLSFQKSGSSGLLFASQLQHHQLLFILTGTVGVWCQCNPLKCFLLAKWNYVCSSTSVSPWRFQSAWWIKVNDHILPWMQLLNYAGSSESVTSLLFWSCCLGNHR